MRIDVKVDRFTVRDEREQLREHFTKRASEAPIPNPFDPESMRIWDEYCTEMHELEAQLRESGEQL